MVLRLNVEVECELTKILVVDDEDDIVELTERLLRSNGYEVSTAKDGDEALELMINDDIDLVILDIMMPNKHGLDVIREMKANKNLKNIIIMVFSALGTGTKLLLKQENQADYYVQKPFRAKVFLDQINEIMRKKIGISPEAV